MRNKEPGLLAVALSILISCAGCQFAPAIVSCTEPEQTKTWLLSDIDPTTFESHPDGSFRFPFHNGTTHSVSLRVRSIGCSCYQLRRGSTRLRVGDRVEIPAGRTESLGLFVSVPVGDQSNDYRFSMEYELAPDQPVQVIDCQGTMVGVADFRLAPSLLSVEFTKGMTSKSMRFEVIRSARELDVVNEPVEMTGWPANTVVSAPTPTSDPQQLPSGLWQRRWSVMVDVAAPKPETTPQEFVRIQLSGGPLSPLALRSISAPWSVLQLMVRQRSGISGPKLVHLGEIRVGDTAKRRIQLSARDETPFRILGPDSPDQEVTIRQEAADPSTSHWAEVTLKPSETGAFHHPLEVLTDHPEFPRVVVEVRANVIPGESDTVIPSPLPQ